jgi:DHA1 family multidrug resistance protein-like MFS transporter
MQVGMGVGLGLGPVVGGFVADAWGYRAAFYVTAILLALAGIIVFFGVKEHPPAAERDDRKRPGFLSEWRRVLSSSGVMTAYALRFLNQMGRVIFIPVLPMFILVLIDTPEGVNSLTGLVIGVAAATTASFAVFLGRLGDRIGHRRILIACSLACFFFFLLQSLTVSGWQLVVLQAFTGAAFGGIVPGISALLADCCRIGDEGAVYGLDNSIVSGARVVGPMLGVSIAMGLGLRAVFVAGALIYFGAAVLAVVGLPKSFRAPKPE